MTDDERNYLKSVTEKHPELCIGESDCFDIDFGQLRKLVDVIEYFEGLDWFVKCKSVDLDPTWLHGWVVFKFVLLSVSDIDDEIKKMCDVLQHASAFGVDPNLDETFDVSVTIPNIFKPKTGIALDNHIKQ